MTSSDFFSFDQETRDASVSRKVVAFFTVILIMFFPFHVGLLLLTVGGGPCSLWGAVGVVVILSFAATKFEQERRFRRRQGLPMFPRAGYKGYCEFGGNFAIVLHGYDVVMHILLDISAAADYNSILMYNAQNFLWMAVVSTTECIEHVLEKRFLSYEKGERFHAVFKDALGDGIFNSDGEKWKSQRRASAHLFSSWQLENRMSEVFGRHAQQMCDVLRAVKPGETVDIQQLMYCYTFDCIYEIAFGKAVNSLGGVQEHVDFQTAFDRVQENTARRMLCPMWAWRLAKCLNLGPEAPNKDSLAVIRGYVAEVVRERRAAEDGDCGGGGGYCEQADLISLLDEQNATNKMSGEGKVYADDEIVDFITNFTIAGRDTTAALMTWVVFELSRGENEAHRGTMEAEIAREDDVREMHFTQAVLQETLRLWPSVPIDIKVCVKDDVLPDGLNVAAGNNLVYTPLVHGRSPKNYTAPEEFRPQRWMNDDGTCRKYDMRGFDYPAFNAGPRTCLGRSMAMLEAKTLISALMSEFRLDVPAEHKPRPKFTIVMTSRNGMPVHVSPRKA